MYFLLKLLEFLFYSESIGMMAYIVSYTSQVVHLQHCLERILFFG
jgi:hypothetical protein